MKKMWKAITIISLVLLILGAAFIGVAMISGTDPYRVQTLFGATYNLDSFKEYYTGIVQNLLGIQPLT